MKARVINLEVIAMLQKKYSRLSNYHKSEFESNKLENRYAMISHKFNEKENSPKYNKPRLKNQTPQTAKRPFRINQKIISSSAKVAGYFLKYFMEVNRKGAYARKMSKVLKRQLGHCRDRSEDLPENVKSIFCSSFSMHELNMALNGLKNRKSPGVDSIHPEFLKHLGQTAKANLLKFFNIIWTTGSVPSLWRKAIIFSRSQERQNPEEISNYRPISLTNLMSKTMERMVYNRLNWYLESHSMLAEEQAGFRKFKSTAHHVTLLSRLYKDALDSKQVLTAIAVDLKSAYERFGKENLLFKLNNMGISGHLLNWIKIFFESASDTGTVYQNLVFFRQVSLRERF
ncbi:putative RNA-directed DNA polymerase from transposon BS [Caerostris extrusa]|uniref:RNA-directed DNA polymerase from transposon BS n=1 Tax=Caerostris extrusa TaxID=172846 RepID=A0AAV4RHI7_CAEEX|nr:putative RNA-directed DNA polymerase from transposon BS [Caerostris extrusa]